LDPRPIPVFPFPVNLSPATDVIEAEQFLNEFRRTWDSTGSVGKEIFMGQLLSEDVLVPVAVFAMIVLLVWIGHKSKSARVQEQAEIRKRLLEKFSSGQELTEFLATPQGQSFLKDQEAAHRSPKSRVVHGICWGIVLLMLGAAFFGLMYMERDLIYPASILTALGLGILLAAAISFHLYKKWNMMQ
jgi:hypothetical protein